MTMEEARTASRWDLEEKDFEPWDECEEPLSEVQIKAIRNMAYRRAVQLLRENKWSPAEEDAYWNGVVAAFFACRNNLQIPARWFLGSGSVLDTVARWKVEGKLTEGA
jgi:hypothetical protein